jgi:hypothetical protein
LGYHDLKNLLVELDLVENVAQVLLTIQLLTAYRGR